jgi:hypothetical protein
MFTTTTNTTPTLQGHLLWVSIIAGWVPWGRRRRDLAMRGRRLSDVRFYFFLCFACFLCLSLLFLCVFLVCAGAWFLFSLHCPSVFILSFLACSCVAIQECLFYASCLYLLAIIPTFPPNNVWLFDIRLIFDHPSDSIPCCAAMICLLTN